MKVSAGVIQRLYTDDVGEKIVTATGMKEMRPKKAWKDRWTSLEWVPGALNNERMTPEGVDAVGCPQLIGFA
eukprot:5391639-Alexandrium_andersonii.AAC.1